MNSRWQYHTNVGAEAGWAGIVAAAMTVVALGLNETALSEELADAITVLVGAVARFAIGYFLPSPPLPEP